jgi:hypothetical protein
LCFKVQFKTETEAERDAWVVGLEAAIAALAEKPMLGCSSTSAGFLERTTASAPPGSQPPILEVRDSVNSIAGVAVDAIPQQSAVASEAVQRTPVQGNVRNPSLSLLLLQMCIGDQCWRVPCVLFCCALAVPVSAAQPAHSPLAACVQATTEVNPERLPGTAWAAAWRILVQPPSKAELPFLASCGAKAVQQQGLKPCPGWTRQRTRMVLVVQWIVGCAKPLHR